MTEKPFDHIITVQEIIDYCTECGLDPKDTKITIWNDTEECFVPVKDYISANTSFMLTKRAFREYGKAICLDSVLCRCNITLDY